MQLKRQSEEAWQNGQREPNLKTRDFQTSRPCEVRRSGQVVVTFVVFAVFSLSFQAVVLLTKTAINHQVFFNPV